MYRRIVQSLRETEALGFPGDCIIRCFLQGTPYGVAREHLRCCAMHETVLSRFSGNDGFDRCFFAREDSQAPIEKMRIIP